MQPTGEVSNQRWIRRFGVNVLWSWAGVITSFLTGFFLSPYIIHKLGDSGYGVWVLAFAFIDYFVLFDFGLKTAIVNLIARYRTENNSDGINELINTGLFYFAWVCAALFGLVWLASGHLDLFFNISPEHRAETTSLMRLLGFGWAVSLAANPFVGGVEGFQQFKTQSRILIASLIFRSGGYALMLYLGYGLLAMGMVATISQCLTGSLNFLTFKSAFPALRFSRGFVKRSAWQRMTHYGIHAFVAFLGNLLLNQGPPVVIGYSLPAAYVGYYATPSRLLLYVVELVTRLGTITMPNTAELAAQGRHREIVQFGMYLNRYCFVLFLPLSIFLLVYGSDFIRVWIGKPGFVTNAAPLMPAFVLATSLAVAAQFNTGVILFGLAEHATYGKCLVAEAIIMLSLMMVVLPLWGLPGAAWVAAACALLNRGILAPFLMCRVLNHSLADYLRSIYAIPALVGAPALLFAYWLHELMPGRSWWYLCAALGFIAAPLYVASYFTAVDKSHRAILGGWIRARLPERWAA